MMLESERRENLRRLTNGEDVPEYSVELTFWVYDRPASALKAALGLRSRLNHRQHIVELVGIDGHTLFAEFGVLKGIDPGVRDDLLVLGWPEIGGVIGLRYPEGGRQICELPLTTRRPRRAIRLT